MEDQRRDPESLLRWNIRMIRVRRECPEIGWGDFTVVPTRNPAVLALRYDWRGNALLVLNNVAAQWPEVTIRTEARPGVPLSSLLDRDECPPVADGTYRIALPAYGYRWFRIGPLDYAQG